MYQQVLLIIFLLVAVGLVALIILQQGKGVDIGASFNTGASSTLFGSIGSSNFVTRITSMLAKLFFVLSLILGNLSSNSQKDSPWNNLNQAQDTDKASNDVLVEPGSDIPQ